MYMNSRPLSLAVAGALALFLGACDSDDTSDATPSPADTGGGATDTTGGGGGGGGGDDTTDPGGCQDPRWEDATYRVTNVSIAKPAGIGSFLAGLMNDDFEADRLHILVQVRNFETPGQESGMEMTGNAGATTDTPGTYTWFPGIELDWVSARLGVEGDFENLEPISLTFPAILPGEEDSYLEIPVNELRIVGDLLVEDGCEPVAYATLTGVIYEADIEDISVALTPGSAPRPLPDLLIRSRKDYPPGDGEKTGWQLEAQIDGVVRVPFLEP
jgi:hypothetical protein